MQELGWALKNAKLYQQGVYKQIEENGLHPDGNFSLKCRSPAWMNYLKLLRQYKRMIGRNVEVTLRRDKKEGLLKEAAEESITMTGNHRQGKKSRDSWCGHSVFGDQTNNSNYIKFINKPHTGWDINSAGEDYGKY